MEKTKEPTDNIREEKDSDLDTTTSEQEEAEEMEEIREEREEEETAKENELVVIHGAKIKFNAHMGTFKVLSDVPTTQDKLTGTIVENQITNFTFDDGFKLTSLSDWQNFGQMKVQDNAVLIKGSTLPGEGQMPGSSSVETGVIEFVDSGQVNAPEAIDVEEAPVPEKRIIEAYFAKKVLKPEGSKVSDNSPHEYKFRNPQNFTKKSKDTIATEILDIIKESLKAIGDFAKLSIIKDTLTKDSYAKDDVVSFDIYKMQESFERIDNASFESDVYVFAKTRNLDGKEITINLQEKESILIGANAPLPVLELDKDNKQKQKTEDLQEITDLKGTIKDDMVAIPIRLRPKSNEDFKKWQDRLAKGKEDGEYPYTFHNPNGTKITADNKKDLARTIAGNTNQGKLGNKKIEAGKTAYAEDVENKLEEKTYAKGDTLSFPIYKKEKEKIWLKASVPGGEDLQNNEFLNDSEPGSSNTSKGGSYFIIGENKYIIFPLLVKPRNDIEGANSGDYWAANGKNQTNYNVNRSRGRKHAARDLETEPRETVVAIAGGVVLEAQAFYLGTHQVTIHHTIPDGREFIVRYGELDPKSLTVGEGDEVIQGQELGKTGKMEGISRYMIHFEQYTGSEGFEVKNYRLTQNNNPPFNRRNDLIDSLAILEEGYRNTFEQGNVERVDPTTLSASGEVIQFIKDYEGFEQYAYNDSEGYCTIGYGHLIARQSCSNISLPAEFRNGVTKARAVELFQERLTEFENGVQRDISANLHQYEFDALVSLLFNTGESFLNVGGAGGGETKIKKFINNGEYEKGANEFSDVTNKGTAGLISRRNAEINMFKNNIYDSSH